MVLRTLVRACLQSLATRHSSLLKSRIRPCMIRKIEHYHTSNVAGRIRLVGSLPTAGFVTQFRDYSSKPVSHPEGLRSSGTLHTVPQPKKRTARKRLNLEVAEQIADAEFTYEAAKDQPALLVSPDSWGVVAYATAEEYDLDKLNMALLKQGLYQSTSMPEDVHDVLHVAAKYAVGKEPREIYFFREGSVVFWNVPQLERQNVLEFLIPFEESAYDRNIVIDEKEVIKYTYADIKTRLVNGKIMLNSEGSTDLEKYTFSNAMALSVKLALWEASLDRYVESAEFISENMRFGKSIPITRTDVMKKIGELYMLRHFINLSSDLLDTPDFYWDRENLENLYHKTCNHLNIAKRTRVMNEKLNHCSDLIQLLSNQLNDRHHTRLELMIIALITVEVLFEVMHMFGR